MKEILSLLETKELAALGPEARSSRLPMVELETKLESACRSSGIRPQSQQLIRALVLLWHDYLDQAHSISQEIHSNDGSYVHGIMHRREPDYSNAKYWFHRVGSHPAFAILSERASRLSDARPTAKSLVAQISAGGKWDADAFIDACEAARRGSEEEKLLQRIQQIEFQVLLEHFCSKTLVGR